MSEVAEAPAAAPSAPAAAPAAPAPSAPAAPSPGAAAISQRTGVQTAVDPSLHTHDYAGKVLEEQLSKIPAPEAPAEVAPVVEEVAAEVPAEVVPEVPTSDAEVKPEEPAVEEEPFSLEPESIVTPELLSQMITSNPEFGKLLEADASLKGQLYKTARQAAELQPYKELFPDLEWAKAAHASTQTFNEVRETFLGSTTRDGAIATLGKIAELSYVLGEDGQPLMEDGKPVIGDDFYGFVDNVVGLDHENELEEINEKIQGGAYKTQAELTQAHRRAAALEILLEKEIAGEEAEEVPEHIKAREKALADREKALEQKQHGEKVGERQKFDNSVELETQKRISGEIGKILANVKKQGGSISPFIENAVAQGINKALLSRLIQHPSIKGELAALQRLPIGSESMKRRIGAVDRILQQFLPDIAREQLREAGVQVTRAGADKIAKVEAQALASKQTETRGSTGAVNRGGGPLESHKAYEQAQAEWMKANPGRDFNKDAQRAIIGRVMQLQLPH